MAEFAVDLSALPAYLRETAARHLQVTLDLHYDGPSHRELHASYFRIPADEAFDPAPSAVAFRSIVAGVAADGRAAVRMSALDGWHRVKVSDMLTQTWRRAERDGPGSSELAEALSQLCRAYDRAARVPEDNQKRLAMQTEPVRQRYQQQRKAEGQKLAEGRRAKIREDEARSRQPDEDSDRFEMVGGGTDFLPGRRQ